MRLLFIALTLLVQVQVAFAGMILESTYPYSLEQQDIHTVYGDSTVPMYVNLRSSDNIKAENAAIKIVFPTGFKPSANENWQVDKVGENYVAQSNWVLDANFAQTFDLLYVQSLGSGAYGKKYIFVEATGKGWKCEKQIVFHYEEQDITEAEKNINSIQKKGRKKKDSWYIQGITIPVDSYGIKDDVAENGVVYVKEIGLENFRNRIIGEGATNWASVFNHPATHVLLEMRNPQQDVRVLKFKAELTNRITGEVIPGLCTAGIVGDELEQGWTENISGGSETTALISLEGKKVQNFVLPIFIDYLKILEGDYNLRVTLSGNGQEKIQETPLTITQKHSMGLFSVGFAVFCVITVIVCSSKIKNCIYNIGAKGAITIALFSAIAFGGITLPTTILGDLLHVFLGPFSGLATGLLNGVLQYLLIVSLLVLFRKPGVLSLMFLVKFMLSCLMFGSFSPMGVLSCAVYIVVLEATLYLSGFYKLDHSKYQVIIYSSLCFGLADAFITFINLEQMMFFYRLYYADWYLALYMIVNGLLYSSIGSWLGYTTGLKLRQVMGE